MTLSAEGTLGEGITCSVNTGRAIAEAGLHPATGGDGAQLCSGDMLLEALAACAGVEVTGGTVHVEGDVDFRGTLAVSQDAPVGFEDIRVSFELETDAAPEDVETLLRLTERFGVVGQTLSRPPPLTFQTA